MRDIQRPLEPPGDDNDRRGGARRLEKSKKKSTCLCESGSVHAGTWARTAAATPSESALSPGQNPAWPLAKEAERVDSYHAIAMTLNSAATNTGGSDDPKRARAVGGVYFGECPRWRNGRLWFSDFFANAVKSVSLEGDVPRGIRSGRCAVGPRLDARRLDADRLHDSRRVLRRSPDGRMTVHADLSGVAAFHCNDMVVDSSGRAYVGNFGFDCITSSPRGATRASWPIMPPPSLPSSLPRASRRRRRRDALPQRDRHHARRQDADRGRDARRLPSPRSTSGRTVLRQPARLGVDLPSRSRRDCLDAEGAIWIANPLAPECVRIAESGEVLE